MHADLQSWFSRRTSASHEWSREELALRKQRTRVSVVLPARDEAATVGEIVTSLRRELVECVPLIDEIVVIDSHSADLTAEVASAAGARVESQQKTLPHLGDVPGKGEALWKSLYVTEGDVVAFVDADLRNFDPQFVVCLLGPLLCDPEVSLVKAFYDRPLGVGTDVLPAGGGRVTELVARPLLNAHWPALAGVVQPLAGEYAARRSMLEELSFVSGYGVEIGMLIDVYEKFGLDALAQVDLGRREHRNSTDAVLGRMAAQVHLTVLSRLHAYGKVLLTSESSTTLTQFSRRGPAFVPRTHEVGVTERPPMSQLEDYRSRIVSKVAP